jgi:ADP-ribose pyrophosphatase YjhB (NUDIX family)
VEHSAGGVVLRRIDGAIHALLIRDPYRNWGLPKGHLEGEETAEDAAAREVREETGLAELEVGPRLGTIDWYFRADGTVVHKYCVFFAMAAPRGRPEPEVAEGITECAWFAVDEAVDRITYDNAREILRELRHRLEDGGLSLDL